MEETNKIVRNVKNGVKTPQEFGKFLNPVVKKSK